MKEEYYGCFANGECSYYGHATFDRNGDFVSGTKFQLNNRIRAYGPLIAKWTVRFKTKNI